MKEQAKSVYSRKMSTKNESFPTYFLFLYTERKIAYNAASAAIENAFSDYI